MPTLAQRLAALASRSHTRPSDRGRRPEPRADNVIRGRFGRDSDSQRPVVHLYVGDTYFGPAMDLQIDQRR